jgi:hypothetical protein
MALSDLIQITISLNAAQISRQGFGAPLILANGDNTVSWGSQVVRTYSSLAAVANDFATTTGTYLMAQRLMQQSPTVPLFYVGLRNASIEAQDFHIALQSGVAGNAGIVLSGNVNGTAFTYTTNSTDGTTNDSIIGGLEAVIAALSISNLTVSVDTTGGAGFHTVKLLSAAHVFNSVGVDNIGLLSLVQDHGSGSTAANVATDLNAIAGQNSNWYAILNPINSQEDVLGIAAWAESNTKLFIAQTQDSNNATIAASGDTTSTMGKLANSAYTHTSAWYSKNTSDFLDAGVAGACLPLTPGSETWAYKTLAGVPATTFTETQRNNIVGSIGVNGKFGNIYETVAGINITEFGFVSGGEFVDVERFKDSLAANIQADILAALANAPGKLPFTDAGIAVIRAVVLSDLKAGVAVGGLSANPAPTVNVPLAANVSSANKIARNLPLVNFTATLAGAIHTAQITGTITS